MSFVNEADRGVSSSVVAMCWCPNMDLLALAFERRVEVRRLSWQRLFDPVVIETGNVAITPSTGNDGEVQAKDVVTALCWSPDGQILAIGSSHGRIRLHSVENGKQVAITHAHQHSITSLCWSADRCDEAHQKQPGSSSRHDAAFEAVDATNQSFSFSSSRSDSFFSPLPAVPRPHSVMYAPCSASMEPALADRSQSPEALNLLVSGDASGYIHLHALGTFPLGHVSLSELMSEHWCVPRSRRREPVPFEVVGAHMSDDLARLSLVIRVGASPGYRTGALVYAGIDTGVYRARRHELRLVAAQSEQIQFLIEYLSKTLKALSALWKDARRVLDVKMQSLVNLFRDYGQCVTIEEEFIDLLVSGEPADALHQFLSQYMSEQSLTRIRKSLAGSCDKVIEYLRNNVQQASEELVFRLTELRGLSKWTGRYEGIGLEVAALDTLVNLGSSFVMSIEKTQKRVFEVKSNFLHFFDWLACCVNKLIDEPFDMAPSVRCVDTDKVAEFIQHDLSQDRIFLLLETNDQDETREQSMSRCSRLDEPCSTSSTPCVAEFVRHWSSMQEVSLRSGIVQIAAEWKTVQHRPDVCLSRSMHLDHVLPLCTLSESSSAVRFTMQSHNPTGAAVALDSAHEHALAFVSNEDRALYVLRTSSCPVNSYTVSVMDPAVQSSTISLRFYNSSHIAVLSDFYGEGNTLGLLRYADESPKKKYSVNIHEREFAGGFFMDAIRKFSINRAVFEMPRSRNLVHQNATDLAVSGTRGMASILLGDRRLLVFDTENDEDTDDCG